MGKKELPEDLNSLKVTELKDALKERGLTVSGVKADLIARLQEHISKESKASSSEEAPEAASASDAKAEEKEPEQEKENQQEKEKAEQEKAKEIERAEQAKKEQEQRDKELKAERERKEKELKEKELKEKEQKEKEQKEKEQKEKEQKEKEKQQEEQKSQEKESDNNDDKEAEESKKRKTDETEAAPTPGRILKSASSASSTPAKRQRTWASKGESINISSDILNDMLPSPSSSTSISSSSLFPQQDADMDEGTQRNGDSSDSAPRRLSQAMYSTPSRREKKDEPAAAAAAAGPRTVPPAKTPESPTLFIDKFVRPFTIPQVKQLLSQTGEVEYFWMNQVKSQAYVTFKTVEQARATREAIYDLEWPPGNNSRLRAEFANEAEAKRAAEHHDLKRSGGVMTAPGVSNTTKATAVAEGNLRDSRGLRREDPRDARDAREARGRDTRDVRGGRDARPKPTPRKLEDLFRKTETKPHIYWQPLSAEQIAAKKATR